MDLALRNDVVVAGQYAFATFLSAVAEPLLTRFSRCLLGAVLAPVFVRAVAHSLVSPSPGVKEKQRISPGTRPTMDILENHMDDARRNMERYLKKYNIASELYDDSNYSGVPKGGILTLRQTDSGKDAQGDTVMADSTTTVGVTTSYAEAAGKPAEVKQPKTQKVVAPQNEPTKMPDQSTKEDRKEKEVTTPEQQRKELAINVAKAALKGKAVNPAQPRSQSAGLPGRPEEPMVIGERVKLDRPFLFLGDRDLYPGFVQVDGLKNLMELLSKALRNSDTVPAWPKVLTRTHADFEKLVQLALYRGMWNHVEDDRYEKYLKNVALLARDRVWKYFRGRENHAVLTDTEERAHVHNYLNFIDTQAVGRLPLSYRSGQTAHQRVKEVYNLEMPYLAERILQEEGFPIPMEFSVYERVKKKKGPRMTNVMRFDPLGDNNLFAVRSPWRRMDHHMQNLMAREVADVLRRYELAEDDIIQQISRGFLPKKDK